MNSPESTAVPTGTRTVVRTCPLCEATCGLEITLRGRTVERTRGDVNDVFSKGYMCPKGATLGELDSDPDRIRTPLIKRDGEFVAVTWEEAFDRVRELVRPIIDEHGPDAMAIYMGNPVGHNLAGLLYPRALLKALRTRNVYTASTLDQRPKDLTNELMWGDRYSLAVPDLDRTSFLLMLGANPMESNGSLATAPGWPRRLKALVARGGELVVVDPVRTRTADLATQHLAPRVGTDAALLCSIAHVLFDEGLVDTGDVADHLTRVDVVAAAVRDLSPERLAEHTGIASSVVRDLARRLAAAPSAAVYGRIGTTTTRFGTISSWMIDVLNVITGNLDRPGGAMFALPASGSNNTRGMPQFGRAPRIGRFHTRVRQAPELFGEFPTACLAEEIDTPGEGRYRGLLMISGNPVVSAPNSSRTDAALQQLEAFIAIDPQLNNSTRHADVILPAPSPLQRSHYDVHFAMWAVRNVANYSPAPLELDDGMMHEWEVMARLAAIFDGSEATVEEVDDQLIRSLIRAEVTNEHAAVHGLEVETVMAALAPRTGPERILDFHLRAGPYGDRFGRGPGTLTLALCEANPHGIDLGALQPRVPEVLRTPDGKIDMAPELVVDDLDRLRQALTEAPHDGLVLIGRRHLRSNNSWMHNVPSLMTGKPRATLRMHPTDAAARGLDSGSRAVVRTRTGEVIVPVEVTDRMSPGAVSLPHGWLHDTEGIQLDTAASRPGVNSNRLADENDVEVPSWTAILSGFPVEVHAAPGT